MPKYIHTIDGKPAYFNGQHLVFASRKMKSIPLAPTLDQLYREQLASARYVAKENDGISPAARYSYYRIQA